MATCNAGHGCSITCPNGCMALYNHTTGKCFTKCVREALPDVKIAVKDKINFCAKDIPLMDVAVLIDNVQQKRIATPAARAYESVNIDLTETTMDSVIKSLGLIPMEKL